MIKIMFILAAFIITPIQCRAETVSDISSFQIARAYKLGRSMDSNGAAAISRDAFSSGHSENPRICEKSKYLKDGSCAACPENATCNGMSYSCNDGYYKSANSCNACSSISIENGTCNKCSSSTACTAFTCNNGYQKSGNSCVLDCEAISVSHGTCTSCSSMSTCTDVSCDNGYYKSGTSCVKCPDNYKKCSEDGFTCKNGYYKTSTACVSCGNIDVGNGTCKSCSDSMTCTSANCNSEYSFSNGQCQFSCHIPKYGSYNCSCSGYKLCDGPKEKRCVKCAPGEYFVVPKGNETCGGHCTTLGKIKAGDSCGAYGGGVSDHRTCSTGICNPGGHDGIQGSHCAQGSGMIYFP